MKRSLVAYAYWKDAERASAIAASDRFIKLYPNHPSVDYAWYLKGLINFNELQGMLSWLTTPDMSDRDPKASRDGFLAFKEVVMRFPESPYAEDAGARMRYLINALANNEVHVAKYYMKRGAYVAAANRAGQQRLVLHDVGPPVGPPGAKTIASDVSAPGEAEQLLGDRPELIFHLAAIVSGEAEADFDKGYRINLDGTRRLFEAIRKA